MQWTPHKKIGEEHALPLLILVSGSWGAGFQRTMKSSGRQGGLGLLNNSRKGLLLIHREIRQNLAIDLDIGLLESGNQPAVGQAIGAGTRIDTGNPQRPELTLALFAVTVGVLLRLDNRLFGNTIDPAPGTVITFRLFHYFLVAATSHNTTFYARHNTILLSTLT